MTKAPSVYELLRRMPQGFVGRRPGAKAAFRKAEEVVESYSEERNAAIESCSNPKAVHELVKWLFPLTVPADEAWSQNVEFTQGHLAHPDRLLIALQLSAHPSDVSLVQVRQFLLQPHLRHSVAASLEIESCTHFLSYLRTSIDALGADVVLDSDALAVSLIRLVETPPFVEHARQRHDVWISQPERIAKRTVQLIAERMELNPAQALLEKLMCDKVGLSVAADFVFDSFVDRERRPEEGIRLTATKDARKRVLAEFANNVESAAASGELFEKVDPGGILRVAARLAPTHCKAIFRAMQRSDETLDSFAEVYLRRSFDTHKGQVYATPEKSQVLESFVEIDRLKEHAVERLKDSGLEYPVRAAWRALTEGRAIYGVDGSTADD